ncbi:MAG: serine protease [Cyanobacteria bacterium P01_A01_bin.84]
MNRRVFRFIPLDWLVLIVYISSGLINPSAQANPQTSELSVEQLQQLTKSITVKVISGETSGSGILIHRQGEVYTVLTNGHVLTPGYGKQYRIQTPDKLIYPAAKSNTGKFGDDDLGLLQFNSQKVYAIASWDTSESLCLGNKAFAGGFPVNSPGFVFATGQVSLLLPHSFEGGYQIGYTNDIRKGMSGGPLLNNQGKLVGINGKHAHPLWGDTYTFQDGSVASQQQYQQMIKLSWAIPVQAVVDRKISLFSGCGQSKTRPQPVPLTPTVPQIPSDENWLW